MAKILVVDDDPGVRDLLCRFLEEKGHDWVVAENGDQALEMYDREAPDLVLMDILMPGLDGIAILKEMKRRHPHAKVLMITAVDDEEIAHQAVVHGADGFIPKPIDLIHLDTEITFDLER